MTLHVHREVAKLQPSLPTPHPRAGAAQNRSNAGHEFPGTEGLRYVVVRAKTEAEQLVVFGCPGRQHNYWDLGLVSQKATDLQSCYAGQHKVQHHEVGRSCAGLL